MLDRLQSALKKSTADFCEIRFEVDDSTSVSYRGKEIERVATGKSAGGIVRACRRGGWGVATFEAADALEHSVAEACACAALVGKQKTELAEVPAAQFESRAALVHDFRGVSLDEKLALAARYNEIILKADPAIETTSVGYSDSFRTTWYANTRGSRFVEDRPKVQTGFMATARAGALTQRAMDSFASTFDYQVVLGREERCAEIARRAAALLKAPKCDGGKYTVVLDQDLAGVFAHEAFGHLSEADFIYENPKMRELMHLGRQMGVKELNLIDDGSRGRLLGTHPCDDEGTPTRRTHLIKEGVLAGHLHSLETAAKMSAQPTGNARAINRNHPPIVRMTNTYIDAGNSSFDELLRGIDRGLYACGAFGGQTMLEMFTFSARYGRRIENGKLGELVRDVVLTGNVFDTLNHIDGLGNDLKFPENAGGCGKGGQSPLPVTCGAPHLRIRDVVIGGK